MPLRYQDRFPRRAVEERKDCFGREAYYRSTDPECQRCNDYDECTDVIRDKRHGVIRSVPVRDRDREEEKAEVLKAGKAGEVKEGETPFTRFCRDCATGACRGALYEGYQFFCRFRF